MKSYAAIDHPRMWSGGRVLLLSLVLSIYTLRTLWHQQYGTGEILRRFSVESIWIMTPVAVFGCLAGAALFLSWIGLGQRMKQTAASMRQGVERLGWLNGLVLLGLLASFPLIYWGPSAETFSMPIPRLWYFVHLSFVGGIFWLGLRPRNSYYTAVLGTLLLFGAGYMVITYFPSVSTYPFSIGWSETSRYYNASLFFAQNIYGTSAPLPTLHPSRYLLQSIPFLISGLPLWFHRLWQVILWVGLTFAGAVALVKRIKPGLRIYSIFLALYAFLFFFQGPVYYHLMVCVIIVLLGFDRQHFTRSLWVVLAASIWAGISRVNWYPVPGLLAATLYFLEEPVQKRSIWRYLAPPFIWTVAGSLIAIGTQAVYSVIAHNSLEEFSSSFSSDLLWYRLFPNITYPLGILLGIILVIVPLSWVILRKLVPSFRAWHPIRWLGLAAILGILFAGGLVVSVKIGGGSNLHNLDAFLTLFLVIGTAFFFDRFSPDDPARIRTYHPSWIWLTVILFIPVCLVIPTGQLNDLPSPQTAQQSMTAVQSLLNQKSLQNQEVLFITQRHLLTFHDIQDLKLVPEYEKVFLMEMVMANNQDYLQKFQADLRNHRFAMIVSEPLSHKIQDQTDAFSEENNVWVERVVLPLEKYYKPVLTLKQVGIQILVPKK